MDGIVTRSTGSWYVVRNKAGERINCRVKGRFRIKGIKSTNPVVVGDRVAFDLEERGETGVITHIYDRDNYIVRRSVNLSRQTHIIAANIDQAFLLVTVDSPPTLPAFIDRFLVTAEAYSIPAILLFNKTDLYLDDDSLKRRKDELKKIYGNISYPCIEVSATERINIEKVETLMQGKVSLFSGHSGAGKSTLINAVEPGLNLKTSEISTQHRQGLHTTTFAEMFALTKGGYIIDTPGIRGFGIVDIDKRELGDYFPEFFALKGKCKFHNCLHLEEPHCAVKMALESGELALTRYKSYVQMTEGEEDTYRVSVYD